MRPPAAIESLLFSALGRILEALPDRLEPGDTTKDGEELPSGIGLRALDRRYLVGFVAGLLAGAALGVPGTYALSRLSPDVPAQIVRRADPRAKSWVDEGMRALGDKHPERALTAFQKAARIDPKDADLHNYVCVAFNELARYTEAVAACKQALALRREFPLAQNNLSWAEFQLAQVQASRSPPAPP